jgi:hypothetical protein
MENSTVVVRRGKLGNPRIELAMEGFEWENTTMTVFTYIYIYIELHR